MTDDTPTFDDEPDDFYDDGSVYCWRCDNKGTVIVCIDDMCRGAGECMHGDGEVVCPDCKGESGDWL